MAAQETAQGLSLEGLLARYRAEGNPRDLATLFDETAPDLYRLALHLVPDAATAEDVLQETFLAVIEDASAYEPGRPARPWLNGILRNQAGMARRRRARSPDPRRVLLPGVPDDPSTLAVNAEEAAILREAMGRLPEPYRGVALLRWRYGLEPSEIAEVRDESPGTVRSLLHRALKRLQAEVGALPALLLLFRESRGLAGVRRALLRRGAAHAAAAAGGGSLVAAAVGGAVMAAKVVVVGTALAAVATVGWFVLRSETPTASPDAPGPALASAEDAGTPEFAPREAEAREPPPSSESAPPAAPRASSARAPESPLEPPAGPPAYDPALATATLKVRVLCKGTLPRMRPVRFDADPVCGEAHRDAPVPEQTIVAEDGKLANAMVFVRKGAERWAYSPPQEPVLIDQKGCMYDPHVLTLSIGQTLLIRNSDPVTHNIHGTPRQNEEFNHSQMKGARNLVEQFPKEEIGFRIKCDIHNWMGAWAGVFAHPFHGVTGGDGTATLCLPPGSWEIDTWHEYPRFRKPAPQRVVLADRESKEIDFTFEAK